MREDLNKRYELRFFENHQYRNEVWKILTKSFFQQYILSTSDILDIGCGWGEFINNIEGRRKIGIDLNEDAQKYLNPYIEFINQDCSNKWPLPDDSLDVVFTSNFIEHLPRKLHIEKTIIQVKRCLRPNGRFICLGPNIKYLPGLYWDFWDHHIGITEMSLSELLKMHDFLLEECIAKFLPYTMAKKHPSLGFSKVIFGFSFNMEDPWKTVFDYFKKYQKKLTNVYLTIINNLHSCRIIYMSDLIIHQRSI